LQGKKHSRVGVKVFPCAISIAYPLISEVIVVIIKEFFEEVAGLLTLYKRNLISVPFKTPWLANPFLIKNSLLEESC
jgi:hypothetical protein